MHEVFQQHRWTRIVAWAVMIGMIAMRFLVDPIFQQLKPDEMNHDLDPDYPHLVAEILLNGLNGLQKAENEA